MKEQKHTAELHEYLYGENRNLVRAAFLLKRLASTYHRFEGHPLTSSYGGLYSSYPRIGRISDRLLSKLKENQLPNLEELAELEASFVKLDEDMRKDQEMYGKLRARESAIYAEERWRENH